jgi:hypothetical protein
MNIHPAASAEKGIMILNNKLRKGGNMKNAIKVIVGLILTIWMAQSMAAQQTGTITVLNRARLGNGIEDITYVNSGPLAGNLVWIDGLEIKAAPLKSKNSTKNTVLFSVTGLPFKTLPPRGITYLPEGNFALVDLSQSDRFFVVDTQGHLIETPTITYPEGSSGGGTFENLDYIHAGAPIYPDRLLIMNNVKKVGPRIEVVTRSGKVEAEIVLGEPADLNTYLGGLAFLAPDRLLVSRQTAAASVIYEFDITGSLRSNVVVPDGADVEGMVQLPDGRVFAADFGSGRFLAYDAALSRLSADDRNYIIGFGFNQIRNLAWDSDAGQFLIGNSGSVAAKQGIWGVVPSLDSAKLIVSDPARPALLCLGMSYMPDEHLIAVAGEGWPPHGIALYKGLGKNRGALAEIIDLSSILTRLGGVEYIPTTQQFVLSSRLPSPAPGQPAPGQYQFVNRNGTLVRFIDFAALGIKSGGSPAYFDPSDPSGGKLLFGATTIIGIATAVVMDFNGNILSTFDPVATLGNGWAEVTAISTGKYAGAFAALGAVFPEIVIFKIN